MLPKPLSYSRLLVVLALALVAIPPTARAGLSPQGLSPQGLSPQGLSPQGLSPQGLSPQGLSPQGLSPQGLSPQGLSPQGLSPQGLSPQGLSPQGVSVLGNDVVVGEMKGVDISSVDVLGTTAGSAPMSIELTDGPGISTGSGSYISVGGASAVGHYAVAHLVDAGGAPAEDLDLFIAGSRPDPVPNLFHRASSQVNDDITLYEVFFFHKPSGQWASLCPHHDATGAATAMALAEDPVHPSKFAFACTATGVAAKCARIWGFRPWRTDTTWLFDDAINDWVEKPFDLRPFYDACKLAARAGYCQDRQSFTKNGTLVDLFDTRQFIWPNAIENPLNALNDDSRWMLAQEYFVSFDMMVSDPTLRATALQRTRYRELSPDSTCGSFASIDRLERDHLEDGRWANPLVSTPRIEIFSPNYCTHNEIEQGEALPWDCSPCTTAICRAHPQCCSADPTLPQPVWNATCVAARTEVCQDVEGGFGPWWPLGKVWPRDDTGPAPAPQKYLLGPGGAVERTDGVSGEATTATITGWACDPEWPGTSVRIQVVAAGGAPLGLPVYADLALAAPLAAEVGAACDGPNQTTARHGFSFTLPPGTSGDVYVYALDAATTDGPAAPPTLLRNGVVHVPTCAHSEHLPGEALPAACSACATAVCAAEGLAECCTAAWTDECAAQAETCTATNASASVNGRAFAQVSTGWIEAPTTGNYVFAAGVQPSRVFVNGQKLVDWWDGPGPTSGAIALMAGGKYHLRWDRFQASTPATGTDPGLTWQPPGAAAQRTIPSFGLYRVAPGAGTGLRATYFDNLGFVGASASRLDADVDLSAKTVLPPGIGLPTYSTIWEGEVVPFYSETYTLSVVAAGAAVLEIGGAPVLAPPPAGPPLAPACSHDICAMGPKLTASTVTEEACSPCVDQICAKDPFCCNGGYLSYYSTEPEWDAKCVAEVASVCGLACNTPLPSPTTHTRAGTIALKAGVHYPIRLQVETSTSDRNVQLQWASKSQLRGLVPTAALFPPGPPKDRGAGLNVVSFATKQNGTKPDLDRPLASGSTPDLSLAPAVGATGLPVVPVLAASDDPAAGVPAPPVLVSPRLGQQIFGASPQVTVAGIGGVLGGSVLVHVEGTLIDVVLPVGADGAFSGVIPVGAYGARTLRLTQRNYPGATCTSPPAVFCATSGPVKWNLIVAPEAPPVPPAPVITSPRDPTASPNPANDTFSVTGRATPGAVNVCDLGGGSTLTPTVTAQPSGVINDVVKLSAGTPGDPNNGWHKLVFSKAACGSPGGSTPVFVSVGVRPPTVEFPRTGATLPCDPNAGSSRFVQVKGRIPYSEAELGRLWVYEETGRSALQLVARDMGVSQTPLPDGTYEFQGGINLTPGKHLVYFFQMPEPPAGASPAERDAHVRGFASIANTPTSRIEIRVPPPSLDFPFRGQTLVTTSPFKFGAGNCAAGQTGASCALPNADVNIHVGPRVWTVRADANGNWDHTIDLPPGWHPMTIAQVVDSRAGGGWSESCPSDGTVVGVTTPDDDKNRPTLKLPGNLIADAQDARGAKVEYDASATTSRGTAALVECKPRSGATFRVGVTPVFCTAVDPETKAVALGGFTVTVVDGPPVVKVPKGLVAEAQSALGALVAWQASAFDVVSGDLPVECVPASPALFAVDEQAIVRCAATDASGQTTTESFPVRVQDTTPPTMCALPDLRVLAAGPGGGVVKYDTCATDLVDGAVGVSCDRPSGSFFPVGKTLVTCTATDRHKNTAPAKQFVVDVGDSTPPVLKLPGTLQVTATSRLGAKVTYAVTATDDTDPKPVVACEPKSGATFPLGTTTVKCTATDAFGNRATGAFTVRVVLAWSDFLTPISPRGTSIFLRPIPVAVRFTLADGSAGIKDLAARLFLARIDAAGRVGAEQPAAGLPPGLGNAFVYNPLLREYDLLLDIHALPAGPWQLRADLGDGVARTVKITLR